MRVIRLIEPGLPLVPGAAAVPQAGPKDVVVKVAACNLIPNVANITSGRSGMLLAKLPAIFGLDVAGTIDAVGGQVVDLKVGERVYVDPFLTCESCRDCRRGRPDLCPYGCLRGYMTWSAQGLVLLNQYPHGGLSEYVASPHRKIVRLPASIDFDTASRFGYLGTSYAALKKGGFRPGCTLLINGVTGTLGVGAVLLALGMGAGRIIGVGRNRALLERIKALAPQRIEVVVQDMPEIAQYIRNATQGRGADLMYDCLGFGGEALLTNRLLRAVGSGGRCVLVGGGVSGDLVQSYLDTLIHDVHIVGSMWFSDAEIDETVGLVANGIVDLSSWETRAFAFDEVNAAIQMVASRPGGFINVVVRP